MLLLTELPEDILLEITSHLANDRQALMSLTVTSRMFCSVTLPRLYRNVDLDVWSLDRYSSKFETYQCTINQRPDLGLLTKSLNLRLQGRTPMTESYKVFDRVMLLLRKLPNVLSFGLKLYEFFGICFKFEFLDARLMSSLREFKIKDHSKDIYDLFHQTTMHNVHSVHVEDMKRLEIMNSPPVFFDGIELSLKSLSFGSNIYIQPETMRGLLQQTPSLKLLICNISAMIGRPRSLSDCSAAHVLEPVRHSLTTLHLRKDDLSHWLWASLKSSRFDLSSFKSLKILSIPARCFHGMKECSMSARDVPERGVYRLLPPNLEQLTVSCGC